MVGLGWLWSVMFHHLAHLLCQFCLLTMIPSRIRNILIKVNPNHLSDQIDGQPCWKKNNLIRDECRMTNSPAVLLVGHVPLHGCQVLEVPGPLVAVKAHEALAHLQICKCWDGCMTTGWPVSWRTGFSWLRYGMFHHPAWAVGSYSSGPQPRDLPKSKSIQPRFTRRWATLYISSLSTWKWRPRIWRRASYCANSLNLQDSDFEFSFLSIFSRLCRVVL